MTATGAENLGDELITLCEIWELREKNPEANIILFSHDPERSWRFLYSQNISEKKLTILPYFPTNINKYPLKNIVYFLQTLYTIYRSDHIYIGWGGLLYSATEEWHSPLWLWWMRAKMAKIFRKPITYLSLWISAKEEELRKYAKWIFENTTITVRDLESHKLLLSLWYKSTLKPDPVFTYQAKENQQQKQKTEFTIGIALRAWFIPDEVLTTTIKKLLQKNYTIFLLPHSLHPDDTQSHDGYYLQKFLFPGVKIAQTIEQTLAAYALCDIIIGMRLHSIILASVMKIPLLAISYSKKTWAVLTEIGQPFITPEKVTPEIIISKIEDLIHS